MSDLVLSNVKSMSALVGFQNASVFDVPGVGGVGFPRISFRKSRFSVVRSGEDPELIRAGGHPVSHLDTIIIGANPGTYKAYYAKAYDPNAETEAPDCYSNDGVAPAGDVASTKKQSVSCASCPMNVFGSRINAQTGAKIKACSDSKRLLVLASDDPAGEVYQVSVSATALKGWVAYVRELSRYGLTPMDVVTRLAMNDVVDYPQVTFKAVMQTPPDAVTAIHDHLQSDAVQDFMRGLASVGAAALGHGADVDSPAAPVAPVAPVATAPVAPVAAAPVAPVVTAPVAPVAPVATHTPRVSKRRGFGSATPDASSEPGVQPVSPKEPAPPTLDASVDSLLDEWN